MLPDDIKDTFTRLDAAANAIKEERKKFQETAKYRQFEEALEEFCLMMDETAKSGDIIKIMEDEYGLYETDKEIVSNYESKIPLMLHRQSYFICGQALDYLKKLDAEGYRRMVTEHSLHDHGGRPRFDAFILLWIQLFKYLQDRKKFCYTLFDMYDYRKFYDARLKNLLVAIRLYRQWQNKIMGEIKKDAATATEA